MNKKGELTQVSIGIILVIILVLLLFLYIGFKVKDFKEILGF